MSAASPSSPSIPRIPSSVIVTVQIDPTVPIQADCGRLHPEPGFHRRHLPRNRRRQRELTAAHGPAGRGISGHPLAAQHAAAACPGRTGARRKLQHGRRAGERSPERPKSEADRGIARDPRRDAWRIFAPPPMSSSAVPRISMRRWRISASPAHRSPRRSAMSTTRSPALTARSRRPTRPWLRSTMLSCSQYGVASADTTMQKIGLLSDDARKVVNGQGVAQLTQMLAQTRALIASLTRISQDLEREPSRLHLRRPA